MYSTSRYVRISPCTILFNFYICDTTFSICNGLNNEHTYTKIYNQSAYPFYLYWIIYLSASWSSLYTMYSLCARVRGLSSFCLRPNSPNPNVCCCFGLKPYGSGLSTRGPIGINAPEKTPHKM